MKKKTSPEIKLRRFRGHELYLPWDHNDSGLINGTPLDEDSEDYPFIADTATLNGMESDADKARADFIVHACNRYMKPHVIYCTVRDEVQTGDSYLFETMCAIAGDAKQHCQDILDFERESKDEPRIVLRWTDKLNSGGFYLAVTEEDVFKIYEREVTL